MFEKRVLAFLSKNNIQESDVSLINELPILHHGWEMDASIWITKLVSGKVVVVGTNHGSFCFMSKLDLESKMDEYFSLAEAYKAVLQEDLLET